MQHSQIYNDADICGNKILFDNCYYTNMNVIQNDWCILNFNNSQTATYIIIIIAGVLCKMVGFFFLLFPILVLNSSDRWCRKQ